MSLSKVKEVYEARKQEVHAIADADYKPFLKWLAENKPELYADTLTANAAHKQPKKLIMKVMYEYMQWKAGGGQVSSQIGVVSILQPSSIITTDKEEEK